MVKLDNGSYRCFVLLEYPVAQANEAFQNLENRLAEQNQQVQQIRQSESVQVDDSDNQVEVTDGSQVKNIIVILIDLD